MKPKIMYIENKSEGHCGSAWIGYATFSKSGQTVYFDNKALKKLKITGINGNHYDIETGEEYWVSGIKKNGADRHWAGDGKVMLEKKCIEEYLRFIKTEVVDEKKYIIVELEETDKNRFNEIENSELENEDSERLTWDRKKNTSLKKAIAHNSSLVK